MRELRTVRQAGSVIALGLFAGAVLFALAVSVGVFDKARAAAPAAEAGVLNVRTLNVVDDNGKVLITLTATKGAHGLWVNGFKDGAVAGIVANDVPGMGVPYLMAFDYSEQERKDGALGCQFAATVVDGEPNFQFAGRGGVKAFRSFNPLRDKLEPVRAVPKGQPDPNPEPVNAAAPMVGAFRFPLVK